MRTRGSSAAGLLFLLLCLGTRSTVTDAGIVRTRREVISNSRQTTIQRTVPINDNANGQILELLDIGDPRKINSDILALVERQNDVPRKSDAESSLDQQVDQSEIILVNSEDPRDLENIEHALTAMDYEPQKINRKGKRKILGTFNNNADSVVSSSDNSNLAAPDVANIYYEVPRTVPPKKVIVTPQYYTRPTPEASKSSEIEIKPRSRDIDYIYPVSTPKPQKPRLSRTRSPLNLQTTPTVDPTKFENTPSYRTTYSTQSIDPFSRKQKQYTDTTIVTTPSTDVSYPTKATRRKKSRKRVVDRSSAKQEPVIQENSTNNNDNYPSGFNKSRSPEGRNKSRRVGLLAKYDVAPRPFSSTRSSKASQEGNLEKSVDGGVASGVTGGSNNRNAHPNAMKTGDRVSNSYLKVVDPARASLNRKLYERKDNRESSTVQVKMNGNPLTTEGPNEERHGNSYKNNYSEETKSNRKPLVTPSSLDEYQNIKTPVVTVHSVSPVASTVAPYTVSNLYSNDYVYYPPLLSTLAPEKTFEIRGSTGDWNSELKLGQPKKRRNDETEGGDEKYDKGESDGIAEATNVGNDGDEESKETGKYAIHESPDEGYRNDYSDHQSHENIQDDQSTVKNSGGDSDETDQEKDKGYRRYAQKYRDKKEEDVQSDSTHDTESHQSLKEGAAGGDVMEKEHGGGQKKFEKGEAAERDEEHHEAEGEKGKKDYKSWHEEEKANKGHHDKERHSNYYDENDGKEKEHKDEGGYHEEHQEGEKGEKQSEFGEKGEHQKGYSTKGQHSVHKKDEFEKRTEFFDEFNEDGDMENDGEFYQEHKMSKGNSFKVGHHDQDDHEEKYGKKGKHEKGSLYNEHKGHKIDEGDDNHYENEDMHGKKKDHHDGKKWSYKEGDDGETDKEKN